MSENDNPYRPPYEDQSNAPNSPVVFHSHPETEKTNWDGYHLVSLRFLPHISIFLTLFYMGLAYEYPLLWAYGTGVVIALGSGLFTTKLLLKLESPLFIWGLAPVFGTCCILFFWIIYMLIE